MQLWGDAAPEQAASGSEDSWRGCAGGGVRVLRAGGLGLKLTHAPAPAPSLGRERPDSPVFAQPQARPPLNQPPPQGQPVVGPNPRKPPSDHVTPPSPSRKSGVSNSNRNRGTPPPKQKRPAFLLHPIDGSSFGPANADPGNPHAEGTQCDGRLSFNLALRDQNGRGAQSGGGNVSQRRALPSVHTPRTWVSREPSPQTRPPRL